MNPEQKMKTLQELSTKAKSESKGRTAILSIFDEGTFTELFSLAATSEEGSSVIAGYGCIEGNIVYAYAQNSDANKGSLTKESAKKIKKIYELAVKNGCPVVSVFDSNGADVSQGMFMLNSYGKILAASNSVSGVVPQVAVVLGTCAGLSSLIACSADFVVMNEKAELFLTPPFVAKANGKASKDAGTAKAALSHGLANVACDGDDECVKAARQILSMLPSNNLSVAPLFEAVADPNGANTLASTALNMSEADTKAVVSAIVDTDTAIEVSADYGKAITTTLATIAGSVCGVVATDKQAGAIDADACAKATKFVKLCDAYNIPVVTIIDSLGFENTSCSYLVKNAVALASTYAESTTPKVNVITGNAVGSAFMTLAGTNANADVTFSWPTACISALAPETAVEFLWADRFENTTDADATRAELVAEYVSTIASPFEAAKSGIITDVIDPANTRAVIISSLDMLSGKRVTLLPKKHNNN